MADQTELQLRPTQAGIDEMCLRYGRVVYANIETELLLRRERSAHQQQMATMLKSLPPDMPPADAEIVDGAPTPIKPPRAQEG